MPSGLGRQLLYSAALTLTLRYIYIKGAAHVSPCVLSATGKQSRLHVSGGPSTAAHIPPLTPLTQRSCTFCNQIPPMAQVDAQYSVWLNKEWDSRRALAWPAHQGCFCVEGAPCCVSSIRASAPHICSQHKLLDCVSPYECLPHMAAEDTVYRFCPANFVT